MKHVNLASFYLAVREVPRRFMGTRVKPRFEAELRELVGDRYVTRGKVARETRDAVIKAAHALAKRRGWKVVDKRLGWNTRDTALERASAEAETTPKKPRAVAKLPPPLKHKTHIVVDGVKLMVEQDQHSVTIRKLVGRDRKRKLDITNALTFSIREQDNIDPVAIALMHNLKQVAAWQTARCTCDYRYGYSDHAEHCQSLYVAKDDGPCIDDDD